MTRQNIRITDPEGNSVLLHYRPNEYPTLLALISDNLPVNIGDCKGRAWCGTCAVRKLEGKPLKNAENHENQKLQEIQLDTRELRLACQIIPNHQLHESHWEIVDSRKYM